MSLADDPTTCPLSPSPIHIRPTEEVLRAVAEGTAAATGEDFFYSLAKGLAVALGRRYCFLTQCLGSPPSRLSTLAFWNGDDFEDNFEYNLAGTPCENVIAGEACLYDRDIQALFPDDQDLVDLRAESYAAVPFQNTAGQVTGHLVVLDVDVIEDGSLDLSVLKIFAARAGAELERQQVLATLQSNQKVLRESESRLRQVIDLVPHFIFAKDSDGRFILVNRAVADAYGTTVDGLLGKKDSDFVDSAEEVEQFRDDDLEVIRSGRKKVIAEEQVTDSEGHVRFLETTKIPFSCANSDLPSVLGVAIDITERKLALMERERLDDQMRQAQKLESLGILAGGIAHDFNNLLVGILGNAGLALSKLYPGSPCRPNVEGIETAAKRAAELSNQMLAYSGRGKFVVQQIDLKILVEDMLHLLQTSVTKRATLKLDLPPSLPAVEADVTEIRQVVMNLITNAGDALGDREGVISVSTRVVEVDRSYFAKTYLDDGLPAGRYLALEVTDTGCGMDSATRQKIFDPFFTTKFSGRGLGLAAVLGIVRGHGGAIEVASEPRRGTTFRVLLPISASEPQEPPPSPAQIEVRGGGRTILVVDDDPTVREIATEILQESGFNVLIAKDGIAALESIRRNGHEIGAVLLDMTMPNMDGVETLHALRKLRGDIKVVMTSGYSEQEASQRTADAHPEGFIQKPYPPRQLVMKLAEVLEPEPETP